MQTEEPRTIEVRKARAADVASLAVMLARAFDDDPLANWAIRQDAKRSAAFRRFFEVTLRYQTLPYHEVYTTSDLQGAALWTPPGKWKQGLWQQLIRLPDWIAVVGLSRLVGVSQGLDTVFRGHPRRPHYYLYALGVEPSHQGQGLGTALMQPVLKQCDGRGVPAYLESSKERNLPLYERNGFHVTEELVIARNGPKLWRMWREPLRDASTPQTAR